MNCSVKFFAPIVTAGLPLPGWAEAPVVWVLLLLLLSLLLPQAATATAMASATASAMTGRVALVNTWGAPFVGSTLPLPQVSDRGLGGPKHLRWLYGGRSA